MGCVCVYGEDALFGNTVFSTIKKKTGYRTFFTDVRTGVLLQLMVEMVIEVVRGGGSWGVGRRRRGNRGELGG